MSQTTCKICATNNGAHHFYRVFENEHWIVRHSEETNILGYCIIDAKRHFLDLSEANENELATYGKMLGAVMAAIRATVECERVYTFSLAEAVPHFHVHVIPRRKNFPRAYAGRGIMSYPLQPAADRELAQATIDRLKKSLARQLCSRTAT